MGRKEGMCRALAVGVVCGAGRQGCLSTCSLICTIMSQGLSSAGTVVGVSRMCPVDFLNQDYCTNSFGILCGYSLAPVFQFRFARSITIELFCVVLSPVSPGL